MFFWLCIGLCAAVAGALLVPLEIAFRAERRTAWTVSARVRWLYGLLELPIDKDSREPSPRPRKKAAKKTRSGDAIRLLRNAAFRRRLWRLLRRLFAALRLRDFRLRLRLGLDDPADTGMLWALLGPALAAAPRRWRSGMDVAPQFAGATLDFATSGRVGFVPARVLWLGLGFAVSPVTLRAALGSGGRS